MTRRSFQQRLITQLYVQVDILRACGKQSLTHYFSKRGDFFP